MAKMASFLIFHHDVKNYWYNYGLLLNKIRNTIYKSRPDQSLSTLKKKELCRKLFSYKIQKDYKKWHLIKKE